MLFISEQLNRFDLDCSRYNSSIKSDFHARFRNFHIGTTLAFSLVRLRGIQRQLALKRFSMKTIHKKFLGQLLVESFLITQAQLEKALNAQREQGGRLAALLMQLGYLKPSKFCAFMAKQPGIASICINSYAVDHALVKIVPREFAESHEVFPLDQLGSLLTVAMVCPLDLATIQELEQITGLRVKPLLCEPSDLYAAIQRYYPLPDEIHTELMLETHYMAHDRVQHPVAPPCLESNGLRHAPMVKSHTSDDAVYDFASSATHEKGADESGWANIVPFNEAFSRRLWQNVETTIQVFHCSPCPSCGQETPGHKSGYAYCVHCGVEFAKCERVKRPMRNHQSSVFCWPAATA